MVWIMESLNEMINIIKKDKIVLIAESPEKTVVKRPKIKI